MFIDDDDDDDGYVRPDHEGAMWEQKWVYNICLMSIQTLISFSSYNT